MSCNEKIPDVTPLARVAALERLLEDCFFSEDYVAVIRALVATRDPDAIRVLASLLDDVGPVAEESIAGLIRFAELGEAVIPAMRECIESLDYEMIRHGHRVLAALGDEASERWLRDDDHERIEAYFDRIGLGDFECGDPVANETEKAKGIA